jgi:hypothetical protein
MKFVGLHKIIISSMVEAIKFDQDIGKQIVERLTDLIQFHPKFMLPISLDLLNIMNQIIKTKDFDDSLRNAGLTNVIQLC